MSYPRPRVLSFTLTNNQIRVKLFLRAFSMSILQASGVYLIAHGSLLAGFTGFLISWNWATAAREIGDHRPSFSRVAYAAGGSLGTILALLGSQMLYRMHLL
jgi:hypothetical protein